MPKNPANMTSEERLKRIRSQERKISTLEMRLLWAEQSREHTYEWAKEAFAEQRRLHEVLKVHYEEKERYRLLYEGVRSTPQDGTL